MMPVFADTYFFLALANPRDQAHRRVVAWAAGFKGQIVTTAWVLAEFGNHMSDPRNRQEFVATVRDLRANPAVEIVPADMSWFDAGLALYGARADKGWSFTDCISFEVMQQRGMTEALTGDRHFEQAGFTALFR